jgi:hypothetical protein
MEISTTSIPQLSSCLAGKANLSLTYHANTLQRRRPLSKVSKIAQAAIDGSAAQCMCAEGKSFVGQAQDVTDVR